MKYKERTKTCGPATPVCKTTVSSNGKNIIVAHSVSVNRNQFAELCNSDLGLERTLRSFSKEFKIDSLFSHHNAKMQNNAYFDVLTISIQNICEIRKLISIANILANIHWIIVSLTDKTIQLNNVFADLKGTIDGKTESDHKTNHK